MAKQLLIYENVVPISSETHKDWSVKVRRDYKFASELNSVPLLAAEFLIAAREYPIVFASSGGSVFPAALLGFEANKNIFVGEDGKWLGNYVPAFLRRYPFVFAEDTSGKEGRFTLCIDEEYSGLNKDGIGERLFDSNGDRTQYLETMLGFVTQFQAQFNRTRAFCDKLSKLDLLEPAQARYTTPDGRTGNLGGFSSIVRERLKNISSETLGSMFATDELELCFSHLHSLQNVDQLGKINQAQSGALADAIKASEVSEDVEVPEDVESS